MDDICVEYERLSHDRDRALLRMANAFLQSGPLPADAQVELNQGEPFYRALSERRPTPDDLPMRLVSEPGANTSRWEMLIAIDGDERLFVLQVSNCAGLSPEQAANVRAGVRDGFWTAAELARLGCYAYVAT